MARMRVVWSIRGRGWATCSVADEHEAEPTVHRWFFDREAQWGRPFPRHELEALRRAWRG